MNFTGLKFENPFILAFVWPIESKRKISKAFDAKSWCPPMATSGLTLLDDKSKGGESTFVKQIAEEVSLEEKVLLPSLRV